MIAVRLNIERRRALEMLASAGMTGLIEATLLARGFTRAMLTLLVQKGLARARRVAVMADGSAITVYRIRITTAGRRALES